MPNTMAPIPRVSVSLPECPRQPKLPLYFLPPLQDVVSSMCLSLTRTIVRLTRCQRWEFSLVTYNKYYLFRFLEPL